MSEERRQPIETGQAKRLVKSRTGSRCFVVGKMQGTSCCGSGLDDRG